MSTTTKTQYRPDIDGMRAIAVTSVVLFHAFPAKIPGGFIGVDIFFVISGFLISRLIFESLQEQRFSYLDFYARRIRRIFPALLVVLVATLLGGAFILLPREYADAGRQIAAGVAFVANLLFYGETGYFEAAHQLKPLLHLWSLGIEEQFYITWPLLLAFLYPRTRRLPWIVLGLMLLSLGWNLFSIGKDPAGTFYLPLPRYWELMIGALFAYNSVFSRPKPAVSAYAPDALAVIGLLLIGLPLFKFNETLPFPGWRALPPVLGALCLIAAHGSWINRRVLASRVFVSIGLISYPIYLWHWVLLCALEHKYLWEAPRSGRAAMVALSVVLAWLTYVLIEKPIRFGRRSARMTAAVLIPLSVAVAGAGIFVYLTSGLAFRYPPDIRRLATFSYDAHREYREDLCQLAGETPFSALDAQCIDPPRAGARLMVLWGDSHASSLYQGLRTVQQHTADLRLAQFTASGCPPLLGVRLGHRKSCLEFNDDVFRRITELKPDIVVVEGWWDAYGRTPQDEAQELASVRSTVLRLAAAGIPRIVLVGDLPVWIIWQPDAQIELWRQTGQLPQRTNRYLMAASVTSDRLIGQAITGTPAVFISPIDSLCNVEGCLLNAQGEQRIPVTFDGAHLTDAGSRLLVEMNASKFLGP